MRAGARGTARGARARGGRLRDESRASSHVSRSDGPNEQLVAGVYDGDILIGFSRIVNTHPVAGWTGRQTGTAVVVEEFSAGTHTINVKAYMYTGSVGYVSGSQLIAIPLGQP